MTLEETIDIEEKETKKYDRRFLLGAGVLVFGTTINSMITHSAINLYGQADNFPLTTALLEHYPFTEQMHEIYGFNPSVVPFYATAALGICAFAFAYDKFMHETTGKKELFTIPLGILGMHIAALVNAGLFANTLYQINSAQ